jgi:hypothetical protein
VEDVDRTVAPSLLVAYFPSRRWLETPPLLPAEASEDDPLEDDPIEDGVLRVLLLLLLPASNASRPCPPPSPNAM